MDMLVPFVLSSLQQIQLEFQLAFPMRLVKLEAIGNSNKFLNYLLESIELRSEKNLLGPNSNWIFLYGHSCCVYGE